MNPPFSEADRPPACGLNNVQDLTISQQCFRRKEIRFHVYFHLWFQEFFDLLNRQIAVLTNLPLGFCCCL